MSTQHIKKKKTDGDTENNFLIKMLILLKVILRIQFNLSQNLSNVFWKKKIILKSIWNIKGPQIDKATLKKENKDEGLTLPDFKTYYNINFRKKHGRGFYDLGVGKVCLNGTRTKY